MARGEYAAALDAYQKVQPPSAQTWNHIGLAYHHLFAYEQAKLNYARALMADPHYATAYNNLGAAFYCETRYAEAGRFYKRALKYDHRNATFYRNLGTSYFARNDYKKGAKAYQTAFKLDPNIFGPNRGTVDAVGTTEQRIAFAIYVAEILAKAGRSDEALASLRKAVSYGFNDRHRLMADRELASLHDLPEFHELLQDDHPR